VTLIDFKAGFEDSSRGVVTGLDLLIVVVDPTQASLTLSRDISGMLEGLRAGKLPATAHLDDPELIAMAQRLYQESRLRETLFLLSKVPDEETERFLRQQLARDGIEPIGTLYEDPAIAHAWLHGSPVPSSQIDVLADALVSKMESVFDPSVGSAGSRQGTG
jgi:CO dehydrogenase nickel-insertion accessory protein CooC1